MALMPGSDCEGAFISIGYHAPRSDNPFADARDGSRFGVCLIVLLIGTHGWREWAATAQNNVGIFGDQMFADTAHALAGDGPDYDGQMKVLGGNVLRYLDTIPASQWKGAVEQLIFNYNWSTSDEGAPAAISSSRPISSASLRLTVSRGLIA